MLARIHQIGHLCSSTWVDSNQAVGIRIKADCISVTSCVLAPGVRSVHMFVSIPSLALQAGIVKSPRSARRLPRSQEPTVQTRLLALPPHTKKHLPSCFTVRHRMDIRFHSRLQMMLRFSTLTMSSSWRISSPLPVLVLLAVNPFGSRTWCNSPCK